MHDPKEIAIRLLPYTDMDGLTLMARSNNRHRVSRASFMSNYFSADRKRNTGQHLPNLRIKKNNSITKIKGGAHSVFLAHLERETRKISMC